MDWQIHDWGQAQGPAAAAAFLLGALIYAGDWRSKRRRQAEHVAAWLKAEPRVPGGGIEVTVHIRNGSDQPVYDVCLSLTRCAVQDLCLSVLPPGETHCESGTEEMMHSEGSDIYSKDVVLDFSDASGQRWRRDSDGTIKRLPGILTALPRLLLHWGYAVGVAGLAIWLINQAEPFQVFMLASAICFQLLFRVRLACGAMMRSGRRCQNNARGLLTGCHFRQHRWQRLKMFCVPALWGQLARSLWADTTTWFAAIGTLVSITLCMISIVQAVR